MNKFKNTESAQLCKKTLWPPSDSGLIHDRALLLKVSRTWCTVYTVRGLSRSYYVSPSGSNYWSWCAYTIYIYLGKEGGGCFFWAAGMIVFYRNFTRSKSEAVNTVPCQRLLSRPSALVSRLHQRHLLTHTHNERFHSPLVICCLPPPLLPPPSPPLKFPANSLVNCYRNLILTSCKATINSPICRYTFHLHLINIWIYMNLFNSSNCNRSKRLSGSWLCAWLCALWKWIEPKIFFTASLDSLVNQKLLLDISKQNA